MLTLQIYNRTIFVNSQHAVGKGYLVVGVIRANPLEAKMY